MFHSYFTIEQQILIATSIFSALISLTFLLYKKNRLALFFLILAAAFFKYFVITADNYLNYWDECFHALVAKNLSTDPFNPVLYKTALLPYDYTDWRENHVWLHKQPLFLWQSALSMKIFGISETAYRLPSLILSIFAVPLIYRLGELLSSARVGYFAALLFVFSFYTNSLTTGYYTSAENDLIFMIYVLASCWAYIEYRHSGNMNYIILIAVFSGFAVLTKWLVGFIVYTAWFINILVEYKKNEPLFLKHKIGPFMKSVVLTLLIVLPWYVYIFVAFPMEARYEFDYNTRHFFETLEGHSGDWAFHFDRMNEIYYPFVFNIIVPVIFIGLFLIEDKAKRRTAAVFIIFPFLFFTFAETKMPSFTYIIFPYVLLLICIVANFIFDYIKTKLNKAALAIVTIYSLAILMYNFMSIEKFQNDHTHQNKYNGSRIERIHNKKEYFLIQSKITEEKDKVVLFNVAFPYNIDMMFYTSIITYPYLPSNEQIELLISKKHCVYILEGDNLTKEIAQNPRIKKIKAQIQSDFR